MKLILDDDDDSLVLYMQFWNLFLLIRSYSIQVNKEYQSRGLGFCLMSFAYDFAKYCKLEKCRLTVFKVKYLFPSILSFCSTIHEHSTFTYPNVLTRSIRYLQVNVIKIYPTTIHIFEKQNKFIKGSFIRTTAMKYCVATFNMKITNKIQLEIVRRMVFKCRGGNRMWMGFMYSMVPIYLICLLAIYQEIMHYCGKLIFLHFSHYLLKSL